MEDLFEIISRISRQVRLNGEEKSRVRADLFEVIKYHPVRNAKGGRHIQQRSYIISPFYSFMLKPIPIAALAIVLFLGSISGAAANTLPGDILYPVKIASENVVTAFAFSPEKKAERNIILVERRLKEAETLIARGDFTPKVAMAIESKVADTNAEAAKNIILLKKQNKLGEAISVSSNLEIALGAHKKVLEDLAAVAPQKATAEGAAAETFVAPLVRSVQEQKDAATKVRTDIESLPAVQTEPSLTKLVEDLNASRIVQGKTKVEEVENSFPTPLPVTVPKPVVRDVYIEKMSPSAGAVGTKVTLTGYGFMLMYVKAPDVETGETYVNFGGGYVKATGNASTLTFIVPEGITPRCVFVEDKIQPRCTAPSRKTIPGEYAVSVVTPEGASNAVTFKVIEAGDTPDPNPEVKLKPNLEGISVGVSTDKQYYNPGEDVVINITAKNIASNSVTLHFNNGCQATYAIATNDGESKSQIPGDTRICTMATTEMTIAPGTSYTWTRVQSGKNLSYGQYEITGIVGDLGKASAKIFVYGGGM